MSLQGQFPLILNRNLQRKSEGKCPGASRVNFHSFSIGIYKGNLRETAQEPPGPISIEFQ